MSDIRMTGTFDTKGNFPGYKVNKSLGGVHFVEDKVSRNAIPLAFRMLGMWAVIRGGSSAATTIWELITNPTTETTTDAHWKKVDLGGDFNSSLQFISTWDPSTQAPFIDGVGTPGHFYWVINANDGVTVNSPNMFGGVPTTVYTDDLIVYNASISQWQRKPNGGNAITWESLPGKPTTFPPQAHQHSITDVVGLQAAIDSKVSLSTVIPNRNLVPEDEDHMIVRLQHVKELIERSSLGGGGGGGTGFVYHANWIATEGQSQFVIPDMEEDGLSQIIAVFVGGAPQKIGGTGGVTRNLTGNGIEIPSDPGEITAGMEVYLVYVRTASIDGGYVLDGDYDGDEIIIDGDID
jgi:hypothetical protein